MKEQQLGNGEAREHKYTEIRVLILYTLYSVAMIIAAISLQWDAWIIPIIVMSGMVAWGTFLTGYKTYHFRSFLVTTLAMTDFIIYGICAQDFLAMIPAMGVLAVMLGIYGIAENIYIVMVCSAVVLLYHVFYVGDVTWRESVMDNCKQMIELVSAFVIEYLAFFLVCKQASDKERLMNVIERLENAEQSQNDFLSNMSHELRTPINTVTGMSELVLQKDIPAEIREDVFDIQMAGRSLLSLVSDILDYTELESYNIELVEEPYNIISTINDVINIASAQNQEKNLEIVVDCDATLPCSLLGDEQKIRRIMANLMGNAIKFTDKGCVTLIITYREEEYGINLNVCVKDTGIGMEQQEIDHLFNGFYQVDAKRSRREDGIGLGLTISKGLVQRMGGFLTVHSEVGHGSEFQFSLPQRVLDKTPAIVLERPETVHVIAHFDLEKYTFEDTRDDYIRCIKRLVTTLDINMSICYTQAELERKMQENSYTHLFTGITEYQSDPDLYERYGENMVVTVIIDRMEQIPAKTKVGYIYKPFYSLSIANVLNGNQDGRSFAENQNQYKPFVAPDAKILIVDDNLMNLKVAEGLLLQYKVRIATATSGEEALVKIEDMDYDFVFMDHMMPGMDGVETLHRIRRKPGRYFQKVPIIALTANAIGGAREMFLQEGFQDFVAKPIDMSYMERVLRKHIPDHKIIGVDEYEKTKKNTAITPKEPIKEDELPEENVSEVSPDERLENDGIHFFEALEFFGGDREMYTELVQMFCDDAEEKIREISDSYEKTDWDTYTVYVHALKSSALSIGATGLSEKAKKLEMAGKEGNIAYIEENHAFIPEEYRQTADLFKNWLDEINRERGDAEIDP